MKVQGVIVPLITPLDGSGRIHRKGLRRLIDHVVKGGVDGIFLAGTTGEFARLGDSDRHELFVLGAEYCGGRASVYAGVSDSEIKSVESHVRAAEKAGADFCVASLPYYYPVARDEAERWFRRILDITSIPLVLYNIPDNTRASIPPKVISKLKQDIAGLKDSSGSPEWLEKYCSSMRSKESGAALLCGSEEILEDAVHIGADGVVPSMANVFPELWATLWRERNSDMFCSLAGVVRWINGRLNHRYRSPLSSIIWKKRALELMGICGSDMLFPVNCPESDFDDLIRAAIDRVSKALHGEAYRTVRESTGSG